MFITKDIIIFYANAKLFFNQLLTVFASFTKRFTPDYPKHKASQLMKSLYDNPILVWVTSKFLPACAR